MHAHIHSLPACAHPCIHTHAHAHAHPYTHTHTRTRTRTHTDARTEGTAGTYDASTKKYSVLFLDGKTKSIHARRLKRRPLRKDISTRQKRKAQREASKDVRQTTNANAHTQACIRTRAHTSTRAQTSSQQPVTAGAHASTPHTPMNTHTHTHAHAHAHTIMPTHTHTHTPSRC